jgi:hypothetical protein
MVGGKHDDLRPNLSGSKFEMHSIGPQPVVAGRHILAICGDKPMMCGVLCRLTVGISRLRSAAEQIGSMCGLART